MSSHFDECPLPPDRCARCRGIYMARKKAIQVAEERAALREREAVVRWLREEGSPQLAGYDLRLAESIARGDHLQTPGSDPKRGGGG